jgi:hypothetical protein
MQKVVQDNKAIADQVLADLKAAPEESASGEENPDDPLDEAGDTDEQAKGRGKRNRSPSVDSSCGGPKAKIAKVQGG